MRPATAVRRLVPPDCTIVVDGEPRPARVGETVAAALLASGGWQPLQCGMGACFVCAVTIDGRPGERACIELVRAGMVIETAAAADGGSTAPRGSDGLDAPSGREAP